MARLSVEEKKRRVENIVFLLAREYPDAKCALHFNTPEQLLFATMLSAQCTDILVNKATPALFAKYPSSRELSKAKLVDIERLIQSLNFYKTKAKNLLAAAKLIQAKYPQSLPRTILELTQLPGVGRKTANVFLGEIFDAREGIVVDTHVKRLTKLTGIASADDPIKIEQELMKIVPEKHWTKFSHWLILHGRSICIARRPKCQECIIRPHCEFGRKNYEALLREK